MSPTYVVLYGSIFFFLKRIKEREKEMFYELARSVRENAAAAAAKSLQSFLTLCDPIDGSPPGSPIPHPFSRQEHWSGLPFPSPMQKSEKWKRSCSVMSNSSRPHGLQPTRLLRPWDFPGKSTGVGCHCLLRRLLRDIIIQNDQACSHLEHIWSPFNLYIHFLHPEDNLSESLRHILYI